MRWLRGGQQRKARVDQRLDPIRIFTPMLELEGSVAPTGQRITDLLLRGQDLAFLPAGAAEAPENWLFVAPSDILVVIPPPLPRAAQWTEPSERIGLSVEVPPYQVSGTAHLRKGDALDMGFRTRHPFLPLTAATLSREGSIERFDVAIVNLGASVRFSST